MTLLLAICLAFLANANAQEGEKKKEEAPPEKKEEGKSAAADGKLNLTWKLEKGKSFYQKMKTSTTQNLKVMGMDVNQTNEQEFFFKWEPIEKNEAGEWTVKQTIEGVKMKIDIAGTPVSYDSTSPSTADNSLAQFFDALKGSEFTYTFNPDFTVKSVTGRDELVKKLTQANSRMEKLLGRILSEEALKQMAAPTFGMVTKEPVEKGGTWTPQTTKLDLGPIGSFENSYEYTYVGPGVEANKGLEKVEIAVSVKYTPPTDVREGLPFQIKSAELTETGNNKGTLLYDPEAGRVKSSTIEVTLEGKLDLDIGGTSTTVDLKQQQTTEVETSDDSYVPSGS